MKRMKTVLAAGLIAFINLAAITDVVEVNPSEFHIKFVKHAIITNADFKFRTTLQTLVRKTFQTCSHIIDFTLDHFADGKRQIVKCLGKSW